MNVPSTSIESNRATGWLLVILAIAAALRFWRIEQNGWGADYYSAAVRSMLSSWHHFFYVAFDPNGFISVDKPPLGLWPQVLSAKVFGFTPFAVLLPQILFGVATIWILYRIARRQFGELTALLAAFLFAITPVFVAMNRTNNTDSALQFFLLLGTWAALVATERGSRKHWLAAMVAFGLAFNVKMLAAFVVLPCVLLLYAFAARTAFRRRVIDLALGAVLLLVVSLTWLVSVELTPREQRPYAGSSRENSVLELVIGHNALSRFIRVSANPTLNDAPGRANANANAGSGAGDNAAQNAFAAPVEQASTDTRKNVRGLTLRLFVRSPAGPLRLTYGQLAAQISWLAPLALVGLLAVFGSQFGSRVGSRVGSRDGSRFARVELLFWGGWALLCAALYSSLGGIVHFYYVATLAPALAVLSAVGLAQLGKLERLRWLLPAFVLIAAAWQLHIHTSALDWSLAALWRQPEGWLTAVHAGFAIAVLLAVATRSLLAATAALSVLPMLWTLSAVLQPAHGVLPSADVYRLLVGARDPQSIGLVRFGKLPDYGQLLAFAKANRGNEAYLLSTSTTQTAAAMIITTGEAVMARGGYHGVDRPLTPERIAALVSNGKLRFAMLGDVNAISRRLGADTAGLPVADWIRANGKPVDPIRWRSPGAGVGSMAQMELFDLRPELGLR